MVRGTIVWALLIFSSVLPDCRADSDKPIRAGMVGIDTSHAVEFAKLLNDPKAGKELTGLKIVAAGTSAQFLASIGSVIITFLTMNLFYVQYFRRCRQSHSVIASPCSAHEPQ